MRKETKHQPMDNRGISLVELIISIAILAIIMIPLMSNFYRSMQMNKRAESMQLQSNLAANILEGMDSLKVKNILEQFNGPEGNFNILDQSVEDVMRLQQEPMGYSEYPTSNAAEEKEVYYLGILGAEAEDRRYDILITMDATPYRKTDPTDGTLELPTLNYYPMPEVVNLNEESNTILPSFVDLGSNSMDQAAFLTFQEWGRAYAKTAYEQSPAYLNYLSAFESWKSEQEEHEIGGPAPGPEPLKPAFETNPIYMPYLDETSVKAAIHKTMTITVNGVNLIYKISYQANWTPTDINKSIEYKVSEVRYPKTVENIYLLYEPSIFCHKPSFPGDSNDSPDIVKINNEDHANPINLFIVHQEGVAGIPYIQIQRETTADHITNYVKLLGITYESYNQYIDVEFSNPLESQNIKHGSLKTGKRDRIFDIKVEIYEYGNSTDITNRYKNLLYTLNSTKEE